VFDWLRRLQREGKVRRFGASVESTEEARLCLEQEGLAFAAASDRPPPDLHERLREFFENEVRPYVRGPV
jgi:hypothetical protein